MQQNDGKRTGQRTRIHRRTRRLRHLHHVRVGDRHERNTLRHTPVCGLNRHCADCRWSHGDLRLSLARSSSPRIRTPHNCQTSPAPAGTVNAMVRPGIGVTPPAANISIANGSAAAIPTGWLPLGADCTTIDPADSITGKLARCDRAPDVATSVAVPAASGTPPRSTPSRSRPLPLCRKPRRTRRSAPPHPTR